MESKWRSYLAGLRKGEKLPGKRQLLILLLIGILLMVIVIPVPDGKEGLEDDKKQISADRRIPVIMRHIWKKKLPGRFNTWRELGRQR